jgi:hypothetical protein
VFASGGVFTWGHFRLLATLPGVRGSAGWRGDTLALCRGGVARRPAWRVARRGRRGGGLAWLLRAEWFNVCKSWTCLEIDGRWNVFQRPSIFTYGKWIVSACGLRPS